MEVEFKALRVLHLVGVPFLIPKSPWRKLDYPHNVHQDAFLVRTLPDCRWVANSSMSPSVPAGTEPRSALCSAGHYLSASTV